MFKIPQQQNKKKFVQVSQHVKLSQAATFLDHRDSWRRACREL